MQQYNLPSRCLVHPQWSTNRGPPADSLLVRGGQPGLTSFPAPFACHTIMPHKVLFAVLLNLSNPPSGIPSCSSRPIPGSPNTTIAAREVLRRFSDGKTRLFWQKQRNRQALLHKTRAACLIRGSFSGTCVLCPPQFAVETVCSDRQIGLLTAVFSC